MSNTLVRAAAEGMPAINRRRMLLGLAAASTAAAAITVATPVPAAQWENPELVRLGDGLHGVEAEYVASAAAYRAVVAEWSPRWPAAPADLFGQGGDQIERDLVGRGIGRDRNKFGELRFPSIITSEGVEWRTDLARRILKGRTIDRRKVRGMDRAQWEEQLADDLRLQKIAVRYEAKCNKVRAASGYSAAYFRKNWAFGCLSDLIGDIMAQEPVTMAGVLIQAQAIAAWDRHADALQQVSTVGATTWGGQFAASVLRLAEGGAA